MSAPTWWEALVLGLVQGVTEWLPISSSGHLVIAQERMGIDVPVFFDLWLHIATLGVVIVYYRERIVSMMVAVVRWPRDRTHNPREGGSDDPEFEQRAGDRRLAALLVVATVPIVLVGLVLRQQIEGTFSSTAIVGPGLMATTALLVGSKWAKPRSNFGLGHALGVGCFQALALLPGVSRSGATITGAMQTGLDRRQACDFAFLLAVPALAGATVLLAPTAIREGPGVPMQALLIGGVAAAAASYASLRLLVGIVQRWGLLPFAPYTFALGLWLLLS